VRGVDDDVEHDLLELALVAGHLADGVVEVELDVRDVLPLRPRDLHGGVDRTVDVGVAAALAGVREVLHRAHDPGDPVEALQRLLQRAGHLLGDELQVERAEDVGDAGCRQRLEPAQRGQDLRERVGEEPGVVGDELHRGVDLVGDAGGELADRLQPVGLGELPLQLGDVGDVGADADHSLELAVRPDVRHDDDVPLVHAAARDADGDLHRRARLAGGEHPELQLLDHPVGRQVRRQGVRAGAGDGGDAVVDLELLLGPAHDVRLAGEAATEEVRLVGADEPQLGVLPPHADRDRAEHRGEQPLLVPQGGRQRLGAAEGDPGLLLRLAALRDVPFGADHPRPAAGVDDGPQPQLAPQRPAALREAHELDVELAAGEEVVVQLPEGVRPGERAAHELGAAVTGDVPELVPGDAGEVGVHPLDAADGVAQEDADVHGAGHQRELFELVRSLGKHGDPSPSGAQL
jgi:hypothetical protein